MKKKLKFNLSFGKDHLALPGPSNIPQRVLQAMNQPSPNIYGEKIVEITNRVTNGIKTFANTSGSTLIHISNGHGVWEATLVNLFSEGDKILLCCNGYFGHKWGEIASKLKLQIEYLDAGSNKIINPNDIEEILKKDKNQKIKGVLATYTDTSSSSKNNIRDFKNAIDIANHSALLIVDCIASFGCERIDMDPWGIDVVITASQKGLMTPPGLGYCIINKKVEEKIQSNHKNKKIISPYWDWYPRLNPERFYEIFSGTPPTSLLIGQLEALNMLEEEGRDNVFFRHEILSGMVWTCIEHLGSEKYSLELNIKKRADRSNAVTTVFSRGFDFTKISDWISSQGGVDLGIGLGFTSSELLYGRSVFRIGHMGHLNPHMILGVLSLLEAGLSLYNIPHQSGGVTAANNYMLNKFKQ